MFSVRRDKTIPGSAIQYRFVDDSFCDTLTVRHTDGHTAYCWLWPPCVADVDIIFMAALCNKADHYIFALWILSFFLYSLFYLFPRLISAAADWMSTILPHMI